ncbi:hypothetical protein CVT25_011012 [Psilocybe cyanescens]|uniref:Uncharacterized protein n=1 Tax=Psilocybe cyanescens TaxID=93625 RepID=A0A409WG55_PSICY|nr:hypothetical protein CVT25_011012 [Psilocybe cyanescens]
MLLLAYKKPEDAPILPVGYIITPYVLSLAWLGAYIAMSLVLSSRETTIQVFDLHILVPRKLWIPQKIQMMLDPLECFIISSIAIRSTIERRHQESKEPV